MNRGRTAQILQEYFNLFESLCHVNARHCCRRKVFLVISRTNCAYKTMHRSSIFAKKSRYNQRRRFFTFRFTCIRFFRRLDCFSTECPGFLIKHLWEKYEITTSLSVLLPFEVSPVFENPVQHFENSRLWNEYQHIRDLKTLATCW